MRKKTEKRQLECILTDEETLKYSKEMSEYISRQRQAETNKKAYDSQMKAEIDEAITHINSLSGKVGTGREFREVECEIVYIWAKKIKRSIRKDTGECVNEDVISHDELQEEMEFVQKELDAIPKKKKPSADLIKRKEEIAEAFGNVLEFAKNSEGVETQPETSDEDK